MTPLLEAVLTNAILVAALALLAWLATRVWRNPFFAHFVWLVVLLKFITPPVVPVALPTPMAALVLPHAGDDVKRSHETSPLPPRAGLRRAATDDAAADRLAAKENVTGDGVVQVGVDATSRWRLPSLRTALVTVWIIGSGVFLIIVARRIRQVSPLARPNDVRR